MKQAGTIHTSKKTATFSLSIAILLCAPASNASVWSTFTKADGLAENDCTSISISPQGQILVGHPASVSQLDGYSTTMLPVPSAFSGRIAASPSGQLWMVTSDGLQEWTDGTWRFHPVPEIAARFRSTETNSPIQIPISSFKQGRVLLLLPDRLMEFNTEERDRPRTVTLRTSSQTRLGEFIQLCTASDGGLWITCSRGIAKIPGPMRNVKPDTEWHEFVPPDSLGLKNFQSAQPDEDGLTLLCDSQTAGEKTIAHFDGLNWEKHPAGSGKVSSAWRDSNRNFWAITGDTLLELPAGGTTMIVNTNAGARKYFDAVVEPGGGFWLATSDGLIHHAMPIWQTPDTLRDLPFPVQNPAEDSQGRLWCISEDGKLLLLNDNRLNSFPLPTPLRGSTTTTLFPLKNGTLFAGAGDHWYRAELRDADVNWTPVKTSGPLKALGRLKDGSVCLLNQRSTKDAEFSFISFDGATLHPFLIPPLEASELGEPITFFPARNGDLWLGCEHGIAWWHSQKWQMFNSTDNTVPDCATHFLEQPDDKLWCATREKLWEFDGQHWSVVNGGLEQIYDLRQTSDGSIWAASKTGLHRNWRRAWIQNGTDEGLPSADVRGVFETSDGRVWAATAKGLCLLHPAADPEAPRTAIRSTAGNWRIPEGGAVEFIFESRDKWNLTPPARLLYSYRIDQRDWSPFQEQNAVSFAELTPGKHYFQARAMDRAGNLETTPAQLQFTVTLPWYKEMRLVLISVFGGGAALFFAWLALNRHLQLRRSYAEVERKVAERTRQLEIANRELLQSQKMNALGTLSAGIAHDFNNILSIIKGSTQIIEDNLENPTKVRIRLDRIKRVVEQGSGIVKAMLGFSRDSDGQVMLCDVNEVVGDTIRLLGDRFLRETEVKFEPTTGLSEIPAAKEFIQQILLNFIFNAAEAMTDRKLIVLATQRASTLPTGMALVPPTAAEYVAIAVRDSGCGISPEILPRIFEPFFTTKALSTRRGTGLGLSMAYELAKKLEAGIAVESKPNEGSMFTLILPVKSPAQ